MIKYHCDYNLYFFSFLAGINIFTYRSDYLSNNLNHNSEIKILNFRQFNHLISVPTQVSGLLSCGSSLQILYGDPYLDRHSLRTVAASHLHASRFATHLCLQLIIFICVVNDGT